jgi:hypothetical protein
MMRKLKTATHRLTKCRKLNAISADNTYEFSRPTAVYVDKGKVYTVDKNKLIGQYDDTHNVYLSTVFKNYTITLKPIHA